MRTAQIKVNNNSITALLIAGGYGSKIYSALTVDGWILSVSRKNYVIEKSSSEYKTVSNFVNINYEPASDAESIRQNFKQLIETKSQAPKTTDGEPSL